MTEAVDNVLRPSPTSTPTWLVASDAGKVDKMAVPNQMLPTHADSPRPVSNVVAIGTM
eukprot:CAMPEP_0206323214 /NCGR_PEP_ID=MMETSP0106_2-20121207/19850_1 /ASSEMBLY_ACC=CAM_ASM_000206 /TAXON_ID=81532 /ORGANISM="Acanthoeca-like sp., Strain 10tr" /LENGTH=57 /DNA_ID=CAMNT_0053755459 /DNA_START=281 /DNA_END=454 /DNA_ORIENTATION=-